jgi:glycerol-3-phosphate dehydrogenase
MMSSSEITERLNLILADESRLTQALKGLSQEDFQLLTEVLRELLHTKWSHQDGNPSRQH